MNPGSPRSGSGPLIRKVTVRNYKSIAAAQVRLSDLVFLVGRNGAGKSNFLDALRFVADALRTSLDHALRERGTIREVRRRSGGHPNHFALRFDFCLPDGRTGHYSFRVGARPGGAYEVQDEECRVDNANPLGEPHRFRIKSGGIIDQTVSPLPAVYPDRLFLVAASGIPEFRPVYDALSRIEVYNLNPREIAAMQKPDPGDLLRRDGSNAASVYEQLPKHTKKIIQKNLGEIVPGLSGAETKTLGSQETIEFRQVVKGQEHPWRFLSASMSDGTLRAFGVLLAVFQAAQRNGHGSPPLLIGLEEPEIALHPAAAHVLLAALREGARNCQILVTSHSPDLLDNEDIPLDSILSVESEDGLTRIGEVDEAGRQMIKKKLFTAGELMRQNQLSPDARTLHDVSKEQQLKLFDTRS